MSAGDLIEFITDTMSEEFPDLDIEAVEIVKLPKGPFNIYVCGKFKGAPIRCQSSSLRGGLHETAKELARINEGAKKSGGPRPSIAKDVN